MLPATDDAAPFPWRGFSTTVDALRRRVAVQSAVDAGEGVKARRALFSMGTPSGDLLAALEALDDFERAIVECDDPSAIEMRRLNCLDVLDRVIGG